MERFRRFLDEATPTSPALCQKYFRDVPGPVRDDLPGDLIALLSDGG